MVIARSFVDGSGNVVDGDAVMLMCAKRMKAEGRLKGNAIVATVMSNIGLEIALKNAGIDIVRCAGRRQVRDGGDAAARSVAWR
jgi:phosphomannomutase